MRHRPIAVLALAALLCLAATARAELRTLTVAPQATDARLGPDEPPHWVAYDTATPSQPLLVWLPGTHGRPAEGPMGVLRAALDGGYRVIGLSYLDGDAVGQVCAGPRLRSLRNCAALMRQQRVWGDAPRAPIADRPEDAIVPRLVGLLKHLAAQDPASQWSTYLDGDEPRWNRIVLAGQSQGGGMAEFLAKTRAVAGVLSFSGGWDREAGGELASWYRRASVTPPERWHATYHLRETAADLLAQSYRDLGIPPAQVHALDLPLRPGGQPHGEGIANPAYAPLWRQMLDAVRP